MSHIGDPCVHCGVPFNEIPPGPCANGSGIAALVRESEHLTRLIAEENREHERKIAHLADRLASTNAEIRMASDGLDLGKITLAESFLLVEGYARRGDEGDGAIRDAINWFAGAPTSRTDLRREFMATKNYDRWRGQRSDCEYGYCPRHGSIVFSIELSREARGRELTADERDAAVYYLLNIERIEKAKEAAS